MKVLQVLPSLNVGGVERGVIDLARAMKKRGEETVIISSGGSLVGELQKIGVRHYTLPVHKKSPFSLTLVPQIAAIIEREHIDIVHARSRVPAWIVWLAARKTGRPFMTTCHGYYSNHPLSWIMGWGKKVIVISRVIGRHMIDHFGVSPDRIRLIHRGVDLSQFHPRQEISRMTSPSKVLVEGRVPKLKIINIGRLSPIKGQVEFLHAIHRVKRELPGIEVQLVGAEEKNKHKYTDLIRQTMQHLHLESTVKLLGTRRDIPELLADADVLVLSTLVPEAFGRVIVEAGAVGTPVIATRVGGVLDIIDHEENGLLVPPGDIESMAKAILDLLHNPSKAAAFSERMHQKVHAQFSLDRMVNETLAVYREVLQEKRILVIKLGATGDLILAVPTLRMLRTRFPGAWISVMVDRKLAPLISDCPYINEIIPVNRNKISQLPYFFQTVKKIRRENFDISVDLQNTKWTHALAYLGGVGERYGFARGFSGRLLNHPDHGFASADAPVKHQFRILSKLGVRELDEDLELWQDPEAQERIETLLGHSFDDKKIVGLVVGSSPRWVTKRWPASYFKELAERLMKTLNCRVVLIGSAEDADWAPEDIFEKSDSILNLVGKTSLRDLVPLMKRLDLVVTGDTAPLHIAAAAQTKIIALFGPTDPKRHMPPSEGATIFSRRLACQPCYSGECKNAEVMACMKQISVEDVFQAAKRQLAARTPKPVAAGEK